MFYVTHFSHCGFMWNLIICCELTELPFIETFNFRTSAILISEMKAQLLVNPEIIEQILKASN